jgi:Na+/H+ antiporter NhaD/arsenite permease-like protein
MDVVIAGVVFVVAYTLIATERVDRTVAALLGGLLLIALGVVDQHDAFEAIDLNVIFLLAGMMVLAGTLGRTGFFEFVAGWAVHLSRGEPFRLMVMLAVFTALLSALLDNVTTVVLLAPVTVAITHRIRVSAVPYLIALVLASNIGGTATLIGDPPNILIGSAAGLGFGEFLVNLGPIVLLILIAFVGILWLLFGRTLEDDEDRLDVLADLDPGASITDRRLMWKTLVVLTGTIVGFLFHGALGLEAATIALLGATVLMLIGSIDPHDALADVEWPTLFFFVGLFVLVEAVVDVGIVGGIAGAVADATSGNPAAGSLALLWFSAMASAIVDNIPYTATAIPIVQELAARGLDAEPLWWSLALGACLGGNLTVVGASANIVVANIAARDGQPISFGTFIRYGAPVVAVSLVLSSLYLWVRYL